MVYGLGSHGPPKTAIDVKGLPSNRGLLKPSMTLTLARTNMTCEEDGRYRISLSSIWVVATLCRVGHAGFRIPAPRTWGMSSIKHAPCRRLRSTWDWVAVGQKRTTINYTSCPVSRRHYRTIFLEAKSCNVRMNRIVQDREAITTPKGEGTNGPTTRVRNLEATEYHRAGSFSKNHHRSTNGASGVKECTGVSSTPKVPFPRGRWNA